MPFIQEHAHFLDLPGTYKNLSHAGIKTTDQIYSILSEDEVKERVSGFGNSEPNKPGKLEDDKQQKIWKILN